MWMSVCLIASVYFPQPFWLSVTSKMSPKGWSGQITISVEQLEALVAASATVIERCGWKNMDPEQFSEHTGRSTRISRSDLETAIQNQKMQLTAPEVALFVEKVANSFSYTKRKLRDAGSGRFLPPSVVALQRCWKKLQRPKRDVVKAGSSQSLSIYLSIYV